MMSYIWPNLTESERYLFQAICAFLNGRLNKKETIDWALTIGSQDKISKLALIETLERSDILKLSEPWQSAWQFILENIKNSYTYLDNSFPVYQISKRLGNGDRSNLIISEIVELVRARIKVKALSTLELKYTKQQKSPRVVRDLFSISLTSGKLIDPAKIILDVLEPSFLLSLAQALDAAVYEGLISAKRIGWDNRQNFWRLGELKSVEFIKNDQDDPDAYHHGIAPSVKLLFSAVSKLKEVDLGKGVEFARRWKFQDSPVYLRLWAALSLDARIYDSDALGDALIKMDDFIFWNMHEKFPEISKLTIKRFSDLSTFNQNQLIARIVQGPPKKLWAKDSNTEQLKIAKLKMSWKFLQKIQKEDFEFSEIIKKSLSIALKKLPDFGKLDEDDILVNTEFRRIPSDPDSKYDFLDGNQRLRALETALNTSRTYWELDPARGAQNWIQDHINQQKLIKDIECSENGATDYPNVWEKFSWANSPDIQAKNSVASNKKNARIISNNLIKLSDISIKVAINGIAHWISSWEKYLSGIDNGLKLWLKVWPIALEAMNTIQTQTEDESLDILSATSSTIEEVKNIDTLNNPVGKLVGYFLVNCPTIKDGEVNIFSRRKNLKMMRDKVISAKGNAGLITRHRLLESLPYFLRADEKWAKAYLLNPLIKDSGQSIALWQAIARSRLSFDLLKIIGEQMAEKATNRLLSRDTRKALVFKLIVDCLYSFYENREPAIPYNRMGQLIRTLDDEVRVFAADILSKFINDLAAEQNDSNRNILAERLFNEAVKPFLAKVWPQERSLSMPGISKALSDLPASSVGAFVEAVDAIEPYLIPFDCWSLYELGFRDKNWDTNFSLINGAKKAEALLKLLDRIVGTADSAVIPSDLSDALEVIKKVSPNLIESVAYRRLITAGRKT